MKTVIAVAKFPAALNGSGTETLILRRLDGTTISFSRNFAASEAPLGRAADFAAFCEQQGFDARLEVVNSATDVRVYLAGDLPDAVDSTQLVVRTDASAAYSTLAVGLIMSIAARVQHIDTTVVQGTSSSSDSEKTSMLFTGLALGLGVGALIAK